MIGKKLLMIGGKAGFPFQPEKARKVMTADHHDRELWERYFKPCRISLGDLLRKWRTEKLPYAKLPEVIRLYDHCVFFLLHFAFC
jgi:hypothetical protein